MTRPSTGPVEDITWSQSRTLLKPEIRRIPEVMGLLELVADKEKRMTPASFWESCAVIITPTWQKAIWWNMLKKLRVDWMDLGRIQDKRLEGWKWRNRHDPSWTASLIPTRMPCGQKEQSIATEA